MAKIKVLTQDKDNAIDFDMFNFKVREKHIIAYMGVQEIYLGTYKDYENCKSVLKDMLEADKRGEKMYSMPEKRGCIL